MKNARLNLRITPEDLEKIHRKAQQANKTLTDYVTATCLGKEIVIITDLAEVLKELKAVGRNLNQLATLANMGRVQAVNLTETLECFEKRAITMLDELTKQITTMLNLKSSTVFVGDEEVDALELKASLLEKLNKETIMELLQRDIHYSREVRSIKAYMAASVYNYAVC